MQTAPPSIDLGPILDEQVDWRFKGWPPMDSPVSIGEVGAQGWNALHDLPLPLVLVKDGALRHNIDLMARYCRERGLLLAPHGKTPVAPQIAALQLEAGAWGMTAANLHQLRVFHAFGVPRIMVANQLLEEATLRWLAGEVVRRPFDVYFFVDSIEGVALADRALAPCAGTRLRALVELGAPGGRTGCRSLEGAEAVARAVAGSRSLELAGVAAYEGAVRGDTLDDLIAAVDRYLGDVRALTETLAARGLFAGREEIVVTAGGSNFFDRVAEVLGGSWDLPVRVVLRSGSYVTHDVDGYERLSPLAGRSAGGERLQPALEAWGMVQSRPEPDLAIVGLGKRDVPYDTRLPMPKALRHDGEVVGIRGRAEVTALNDQHAFVRLSTGLDPQVGDLMACDVSHPCTTFDKWRLLPLVDDRYQVTGAIRTFL